MFDLSSPAHRLRLDIGTRGGIYCTCCMPFIVNNGGALYNFWKVIPVKHKALASHRHNMKGRPKDLGLGLQCKCVFFLNSVSDQLSNESRVSCWDHNQSHSWGACWKYCPEWTAGSDVQQMSARSSLMQSLELFRCYIIIGIQSGISGKLHVPTMSHLSWWCICGMTSTTVKWVRSQRNCAKYSSHWQLIHPSVFTQFFWVLVGRRAH